MRSAFKRAYVAEKIDQNPTDGHLEITKGGGKRRHVLTPEQFRKIMLAAQRCGDPVVRILGIVMGLSGLRPAELVEASTADFYCEDGELVFRIWEDSRSAGETLKTEESERFITIHSAIRDEVWAYIKDRRAVVGGEGPLFDLPQYDGRRNKAATNRAGRWLRRLDKLEGLGLNNRQSFYSLRHNAATAFERMALDREITEGLAEYLTGHASTIRRRVYIHRRVDEIARAVEKLPNPFAPVQHALRDKEFLGFRTQAQLEMSAQNEAD